MKLGTVAHFYFILVFFFAINANDIAAKIEAVATNISITTILNPFFLFKVYTNYIYKIIYFKYSILTLNIPFIY
ncbi:hypothetical protein GCM10007380_15310 [Gottfriedia solisilvae]|uniref:Uncharacterized protein n=1 Tax=Gottfriedia solisilvae TaxID=1516104 RepID=A0A8J3AL43_9BACI|nr:hypothetical protein GCM10007380_15310 [Gottfriedia solisilvae]